jgi:TonB family protein
MRKEWGILVLLIGLAGCVSPPQRRPMLDGAPWPTDANGHIVTGQTMLLILVDYRGVATEACIEQSSGNDALDTSAIRRMTTHMYRPEMKNGFPVSGFIRVPVNFGAPGDVPAAPPPFQANRECRPQPVPGISPAELALAHQNELTISPTPAREVPDVGQPWPEDANGALINADAYAHVLVDQTGHVVSVESLEPGKYAAFNAIASRRVVNMTFASTDVEHWEIVSFHFRASE